MNNKMTVGRYYSFLVDTQYKDNPGIGRYIGCYEDTKTKIIRYVFQTYPYDEFGISFHEIENVSEFIQLKHVIQIQCPNNLYDYKYYTRSENEILGSIPFSINYKISFPVVYE